MTELILLGRKGRKNILTDTLISLFDKKFSSKAFYITRKNMSLRPLTDLMKMKTYFKK